VWGGSPPHHPFPGTQHRPGVTVGRGGGRGGGSGGGGIGSGRCGGRRQVAASDPTVPASTPAQGPQASLPNSPARQPGAGHGGQVGEVAGTGDAGHAGGGQVGPALVREVAGVVDGEQVSVAEMVDPAVPGPHPGPVAEDAEGWNLIDLWGVWDCTLCEFPTMKNIPKVYREVWASAVAKILRVIQRAEEGIDLERGLKWLLIIPKAIFRQGRRGGKAGKGLTARRVNLLTRGDWGGLLALLERDCQLAKDEKQKERQQGRGQERVREDVQMDRNRKNALLLLSKGHISKAARIINSHGIGSMEDPHILHQMEQKYPERGIPLPASVSRGQCVDNLRGLREVLLGLQGGVSAGTGGLKPEYLTCLAEVWGDEQMGMLEQF
jgi:hypothetical protein